MLEGVTVGAVVWTVVVVGAVLDGEESVFEGELESVEWVVGAWLVVSADDVAGALYVADLLLMVLMVVGMLLELELMMPES